MGCDIHLIVQVKKDGKWEYVKEVPHSLMKRKYSTFAFLADVRNDFDTKGFKPKGLPDDLGGFKYAFVSETERYKEIYNEKTTKKVLLPDGTYISPTDISIRCEVETEAEARAFGNYSIQYAGDVRHCYIFDPAVRNGGEKKVPYKELTTLDEFLKDYGEEYWDEEMKDYGYWEVHFDCEDYHSHSWLSLKELKEFDKSDYLCSKVRISSYFYDNFVKMGGVLPDGMTVEQHSPDDFVDVLRQAFNPEVIVKFMDDEKKDEAPVMKGIRELEDISKLYNVADDCIRIVFAFDN